MADLVANKPHSELSEKKEKSTAGKHHIHSKYFLSSDKLKQTGASHAVVEPHFLKTQDGSLSDLFVTVDFQISPRFPSYTCCLPSVTRTLDNSNFLLTGSNFCFPETNSI